MRKHVGNSLFVGVAAAGAIALSASAAYAADWDVENPNPDGHFSATSTNLTFKDATTSQTITCTSSTISGSAPTDPSKANPVLSFTGSISGCTGLLGTTGSGIIGGAQFNAETYESDTDTVNGNITGVSVIFTITSILGTCNVTVAGDIDTAENTVTYANGTGTLTIPPEPSPLTITSTSGACLGLIGPGDPIIVSATYYFTPPWLTIRPA